LDFERDDGAVIDVIGGEGNAIQGGALEQAVAEKEFGADQVRVAGEGGETLIGGIAVAGWAEREELPPGLSGAGEGIDPVESGGAEVADAVGAGEGGGVQDDAGGAWRVQRRASWEHWFAVAGS